ncbi:hypothetical protein DEU56DRAFT_237238 [Suillus clintonianus]|uniref:uncharacterized protein n=1 Tax=Suillus clintonianus TaxID=1904413 RepID=UPI001B87DEBE|nr:uncharacterized protein DEU56DRAFT_237238 [Suillus clintonianus]KAG2144278.1 hypothetical protein DEU56DRAFT_237238 [Suillus clintonianus]
MCFYSPANEPLLVDTYFFLRYCSSRAFLKFAACIVIIIDCFSARLSTLGRWCRTLIMQAPSCSNSKSTFTGGHMSTDVSGMTYTVYHLRSSVGKMSHFLFAPLNLGADVSDIRSLARLACRNIFRATLTNLCIPGNDCGDRQWYQDLFSLICAFQATMWSTVTCPLSPSFCYRSTAEYILRCCCSCQ